MAFTLIKGTFHVVGYSPDGDSLKFKAKKASNWSKLAGRKANQNAKGHVQLRFEAIDSLETHYRANGKETRQPESLADPATDFTLAAAGITNVQWGPKRGRITSANDGKPGYILSRTTERYGRPVAFVFAGNAPESDGADVHLDATRVKQSINYKALAAGQAFPTYYKGLFYDLREVMTEAAVTAWNADKGVWPYDWTNQGPPITNLVSIMDDYVLMPKLFRRLADYLVKTGKVKGFKKSLAANPEPIHILSTGHFTNFDTVVEEDANKVRLTQYPEDLIFLS